VPRGPARIADSSGLGPGEGASFVATVRFERVFPGMAAQFDGDEGLSSTVAVLVDWRGQFSSCRSGFAA